MAFKDLQDSVDKWKKGVAQGGAAYTKGVQRANNWAENAKAAKNRRDAGLQRAIADGRIDRGIERTGDAGWKAAASGKGAQNFQANAPAAAGKFQAGLQKAMGFQAQAQAATANMDTSTLEGRLQKSMEWQRQVAMAAERAKVGG